ncbi:MAG: nucleotidyltransferase [Clostridiales bacterium]|jgi:NDP-sugar pyrophosphorylase family protein|nr:sugar phosphate nucleotidyltransferase [Bacillota bacterium]NLK04138.1 nucleotidyltransferase [Clostridiales bacterium]
MSATTLVIMAAGMGSRYGGIKQLEPVGPSGEIIMDYSIYDAIDAGFNKIVFIIRRDIEKDFKEVIGDRIARHVNVEYVFQDLDFLPAGFETQKGRSKPWGTGHAVLCCKDLVNEPFAVINADDYYGKEAFRLIYEFLNSEARDLHLYCMAGFILGNTLSENGTVTRGVCEIDDRGWLVDIVETSGIMKEGSHAIAKGNYGEDLIVDLESIVSMNMWGFKPSLFGELEKGFEDFLSNLAPDDIKKEYLLPEVVGSLVDSKKVKVKMLKTKDQWFGVTYKEDKELVVSSIRNLINNGVYPSKLFS